MDKLAKLLVDFGSSPTVRRRSGLALSIALWSSFVDKLERAETSLKNHTDALTTSVRPR